MSERCSMGVGCDEYGRCYASAHGEPDSCPLNKQRGNDIDTSKKKELLALADRIEKLDHPSDDTDAQIHQLVTGNSGYIELMGRKGVSLDVLRYTASLDAATTLVPQNSMRRSGDSAIGLMGTFFCDIVTEDSRDLHALANSEPCAIVAAALRARAALED